ncbi:MAG: hypothetical protein AAFS10_07935 [Myxococcota bacterium]
MRNTMGLATCIGLVVAALLGWQGCGDDDTDSLSGTISNGGFSNGATPNTTRDTGLDDATQANVGMEDTGVCSAMMEEQVCWRLDGGHVERCSLWIHPRAWLGAYV